MTTAHVIAGRSTFQFASILLAGVLASLWMSWVTQLGPGVNPDSVAYLEAAKNLTNGAGVTYEGKPLTHFPPGYPILIGLIDLLLPGDTLTAARFLACLLYGVNLILLGLAVYLGTARNLLAVAGALIAYVSSAHVLYLHSMAFSEAPYITLTLLSFLLFHQHLARPHLALLLGMGLAAGLAATTRYVGIALFPAIVSGFLLLDARSRSFKVRDSILFCLVGALPLAAGLIRNLLMGPSATNREFAFHPVGLAHAKRLVLTLHDFFLLLPLPVWFKALVVGAGLVFLAWGVRALWLHQRITRQAVPSHLFLPALSLLYVVYYLALLFASISFFDAQTQLDHRLLLPAVIPLVIAGFALSSALPQVIGAPKVWYGFLSVSAVLILVNLRPTISVAWDIHENGRGYTSRPWQESPLLEHLSRLPDDLQIYSNGPDAIRFLTAKKASLLPRKYSPNSLLAAADYEAKMAQLLRDCADKKAVVVYFDTITWRTYLPTRHEFESLAKETHPQRFVDGFIYRSK